MIKPLGIRASSTGDLISASAMSHCSEDAEKVNYFVLKVYRPVNRTRLHQKTKKNDSDDYKCEALTERWNTSTECNGPRQLTVRVLQLQEHLLGPSEISADMARLTELSSTG